MTRYHFGGDVSVVDKQGNALFGTTGTVWSDETAGIQYTDLLDSQSRAVTTIATDDNGKYHFSGPDAVTQVWVDFGSGRFLASTTDIATVLFDLVANALTQADIGVPNGLPQLDDQGHVALAYRNPDTETRLEDLEAASADYGVRIAAQEAQPALHAQASAPSHGGVNADVWVDST